MHSSNFRSIPSVLVKFDQFSENFILWFDTMTLCWNPSVLVKNCQFWLYSLIYWLMKSFSYFLSILDKSHQIGPNSISFCWILSVCLWFCLSIRSYLFRNLDPSFVQTPSVWVETNHWFFSNFVLSHNPSVWADSEGWCWILIIMLDFLKILSIYVGFYNFVIISHLFYLIL